MLKVILIATFLRLVAAEALCPEGCSCNTETRINCTNVLLDRVLENMNDNAQHIIISFSNISSLNTKPMKKLNKLTNITMNYNSIKRIGPSVFNFTNNVIYLDLSSNNIESLHNAALTPLDDLRILMLNSNKISSINPQIFRHNIKLIFLDLSYNFIESINTNTFDKNVHLCWVNLEGNPLIVPSDWNLLFKDSLNTLEVSVNDTNWIMVSLSNIPSLKLLTDDTHEKVRVKRTASNSEVRMNMENFSSYENDTFLSNGERIALNNNLLNKMSKMWNTRYRSLLYNRDRQVVTGNEFTGNPLFVYCVHWSVWFWFSDHMTYTESTIRWKPCHILSLNSTSKPPPSTTLESKIWGPPLPTSDMTAVPTATSTTTDVAENSQQCITEQSSLDADDRNFTNIVLYISIPVCVIIIVVIVTVIVVKKGKRSRGELGTSSADQYFFFFNAFPRSQASEISKEEGV